MLSIFGLNCKDLLMAMGCPKVHLISLCSYSMANCESVACENVPLFRYGYPWDFQWSLTGVLFCCWLVRSVSTTVLMCLMMKLKLTLFGLFVRAASEASDECTPMERIQKNRARWRDNQQRKLEESWGSLNLFNHSHRGRLSIDMTGQHTKQTHAETLNDLQKM